MPSVKSSEPAKREPRKAVQAAGHNPSPRLTGTPPASTALWDWLATAPPDAEVRGKVETELNADLSQARVHNDENAAEASRLLGARAFTYGSDIFLGPGESPHDARLMAHELTHVAQQSGAGTVSSQRDAVTGEDNQAAERQAEAVAQTVTSASAQSGLIVAGEAAPDDVHMTRNEFMRRLRDNAVEAASQAIGPFWSEAGCAYIDRWFTIHADIEAASLEQMARRYSRLSAPATAADYLVAIRQRLQDAIVRFRAGEDMAGELDAAGLTGTLQTVAAMGTAAPASPSSPMGTSQATVQRMRESSPSNPSLPAYIARLGNGDSLDPAAASRIGGAYGSSFSNVRVHAGREAASLAEDQGAIAFTIGRDIVFGAGQYRPNTLEGDALLAHELAHVMQQNGPAAQDRHVNRSAAYEADADKAAYGVMAKLYAGVSLTSATGPILRTGLSLQRCSKKHKITDPFVLTLDAKLRATPPDKIGFFAAIRALAGSNAGNIPLREGIDEFNDEGLLTGAEMFRAVALQELGEERTWHAVIKNFAEGADRGTFSVSSLPPAGADALREYCVRSAGEAADPSGNQLAAYRVRFNAKWDVPPYSALSADFDTTLDSKGPRNQRARRIFVDLYADPGIKTAYDSDSPAGFRNLCDTLVGPEGLNLIASPRIQELRTLLGGATLTFTGTADPAYTTFTSTVRPKAEALDANDRLEIEHSHTWRLLVDNKVTRSPAAATPALRDDLWTVVTRSHPAAAVAPPPPVAPAPIAPPPAINATQGKFLSGIVINAPASPQNANSDHHPLTFDIHSAVPNPALAVRRRVVVEPAAQVVLGQEDETDWKDATSAVPHTAQVNPESGTGPSTSFVAKLTMPPVPVATFPEKSATVIVNDKRLDWFKAHITPGVDVMIENARTTLAGGASVPYFGGQLPLRIQPGLGPDPNPGLIVSMEGEITKDGVLFKAMARKAFPPVAKSAPLFDAILEEPTPAPAVAEHMVVTIRFLSGAGAGVLFHTLTLAFDIIPALPPVVGGDAAILTADNAALNAPIATPGTFLYDMFNSAPAGSPQALVAQAAAGGAIKVRSCIVRSDSAAWLKAKGPPRDPAKQVAYALGQVDDAHTLVQVPGAIGWRTSTFPDTVFLNLTPNIHTGVKRSHAQMAGLLTHEGIHAADRQPPGHWGDYLTEFRAYWIMGMGSGLSTAPDPSMSNLGPKSPRARKIFDHLYGNPTYPFVQPDYDGNVSGFRERVDNYLYPDGINITLSPTLGDLRKEIESYTGAGYPAKKLAVAAKFAACTAADKDQIKNNREWRDLVETKFTGTVSVSLLRTELEKDQIKDLLGIPR